jgi:uncharacterized linocin/CFP29 family protein
MGRTVLQYEDQSDISDAEISMDGLRRTEGDRPEYNLKNLPLPIISKNFSFSARQVNTSRNGSTPVDTTTAELATEKVAEYVEKLTLGELNTYAYGGGTIYGFTNFTNRLTKTITNPTAGGWTPTTTVEEVLAMRQQAYNAFHYGPYMLWNSPAWDQYLDDDYSAAKGDITLRERLLKIGNIQDVRTVDHLSDTTLLLVQMTSNVVRIVNALEFVTLQWETEGGLNLEYKVMVIMVPQLRADQNDNTGIVHGSV